MLVVVVLVWCCGWCSACWVVVVVEEKKRRTEKKIWEKGVPYIPLGKQAASQRVPEADLRDDLWELPDGGGWYEGLSQPRKSSEGKQNCQSRHSVTAHVTNIIQKQGLNEF